MREQRMTLWEKACKQIEGETKIYLRGDGDTNVFNVRELIAEDEWWIQVRLEDMTVAYILKDEIVAIWI